MRPEMKWRATMNKCVTCRWSFAACDYGDGDAGEFSLRPTLMCWPEGERSREQLAMKPCEFYEQEPAPETSQEGLHRE